MERELAAIWAELLGVQTIGVHDNFFDLGGHSLLATQLVLRLQRSFHVSLPLRTIFESPTIAGLAISIAASLAAGENESDLREMLNDLEQLSDDDVKRLWEGNNPGISQSGY